MQSRKLSELLVGHKAKKRLSRYWCKRSSVAIVFDQQAGEGASILMIKRAEHKDDPWSGHMAFPGGRRESFDRNSLATAKREMHEEVGFDIDDAEHRHLNGEWLGRLSDIRTAPRVTSKAMVVSPYTFAVSDRPVLDANYEVAETVWIPFAFFADIKNRDIYELEYQQKKIALPCYRYNDKMIWGMSLLMIDEVLRIRGIDVPEWERV